MLAALALLFALGFDKPRLLRVLDNRVLDTMFQWRGAQPTSGRVVVVDIDEKSLAALGQWPWSRDLLAELVVAIDEAGAVALGFDIVFAEADRTSPRLALERLQKRLPELFNASPLPEERLAELDHDQLLGRALVGRPVVLGYVFRQDHYQQAEGGAPPGIPFPGAMLRLEPEDVAFEDLALIPARWAVLNRDEINQGESEGFFNVFPDVDGTVRRVPLLISLDGIPYPGLALELARIGLGEPGLVIHAVGGSKGQGGSRGVLGLSLGERFIPTDDAAQAMVNFRGPAFTFPYISVIDLLAGRDLDRLAGKFVLIGTSAAGLLDLRTTPFSPSFPGVEVHANLIDNILLGDHLAYDAASELLFSALMILGGGLLLSALLSYAGPLTGGLVTVLLVGGGAVGNYLFFFSRGQVVGLVFPLAALLLIFMVVTLFNYFFEGRQKRFISRAFGQYVPPELVEEMAARPNEFSLGGETRELTVLFSDVRGFTTISEGLEATELTRLMNEMLTPMTRIIHQHRGTIDKYMGDAIMAFWGAPLPDPDHARHALEAGMAMVTVIPHIQRDFAAKGWPPIRIGVGLNSGPMNVGNMGSEFRMAYTVLGDAVNLGSRLEGLTKQYGVDIMVSEQTKALVPDFAYRELDKVRVKGKDKPVAVFEPLGPAQELDPALSEKLSRYHHALELYRQQHFGEAREIFSQLQQEEPKRMLYSLYLQRVEHFLEEPPPEDWDGSFTHTSK